MLDKKTISKALAYKLPMGKKGNKHRYSLKLNVRALGVDPSFLEEIAVLAVVFRAVVNDTPKPSLAECPGYDGECKGCEPCACYEYF